LALGREPAREAPSRTPFLAKGFRPFFPAAALFAAFGVPFWVATLVGSPPWQPPENPLAWHAHEMVFGFAGAVLAGFLLTAVGNWTSRATLEGWGLGALVAWWFCARILPFVPSGSGAVAAIVDVVFWLALLVACARPIVATRNRRNYGFLVLLAGFAFAAAVSHANRLGYVSRDGFSVHSVGVDLVTVALVVMTGRVVPMFTRNATGATDIRESKFVDRTAAAATASLVVLDLAAAPAVVGAIPALVAGVSLLVRAAFFGPRHVLGSPLLWVLHLGHLWVAVGLVLRGLVPLMPSLPPSIALHAVTAGGLGLLSFGMMTRVTLGHTGRMLVAPRSTALAMLALAIAAVLRVVGPLAAPAHVPFALGSAAILWSAAFLTYVFAFGRALVTPRVDGRPG
jgi:uncharacterized protein involved in response to NO